MTCRVAFVVPLLVNAILAEAASAPCCDCGSPERPNDVICLNAEQMRNQVDHIEPLKSSGLDKGLNLSGIVVVEMRFDSAGKVSCAQAKSGHPIAIAAAMAAVPKWTFKPVVSAGAAKGGCGTVRIKYRLRERGSSTKLQ